MNFDNSKPNVILLSDVTESALLTKSFGVYKVAYELRKAGYQVFVLHHLHVFSVDEIKSLLTDLVSDQTLFVGFNSMFYREIKSFDYTNSNPKDGDLVLAPLDSQQRMVGCMLPHGREYNAILRDIIRSKNKSCKLVIGGPMVADTHYHRDFDYVVKGYADISAVNLADHLCHHRPLLKHYRSVHGPVIIDDAKADGFDFVNSTMEYLDIDGIRQGEVMPIEVSRGCIFKCSFCSFPLNGKKKLDYIKSFEKLYDEFVSNYRRHGTTTYFFLDDTFNDSVDKVKLLWEISKKLPFTLTYWAYIRLDLVLAHPETMQMIYDSGCRGAHFGLETLNKESGSIIGKGMGRERIIRGLETVRRAWPEAILTGTFIAGLPKESKESLMQTIEWLNRDDCPLDSRHLFALNLFGKDNLGFVSDIDANPEKFGYRDLEKMPDKEVGYRWTNDYMTYEEASEMMKLCDPANNTLNSMSVFSLMNLGFDLSYSRKPRYHHDWDEIIQRKWQLAREYKKHVFNICGNVA